MSSIFKGKTVVLYIMNASPAFSNGIPIQDPKIEEIKTRSFVVGVVPNIEGDWASGLRIGVAFDQIEHFVEFSSEQEFIERSSLWNTEERPIFPI